MNMRQHLLNKLFLSTNKKVLEYVFMNNDIAPYANNLENEIMARVVEGIVLPDLSIMSGKETRIPLSVCNISQSEYKTLIHVPDDILQGHTIISVQRIILGYNIETGYGAVDGGNIVGNKLDTLMDSMTGTTPVHITNAKVVSKNTILVPKLLGADDGIIDCKVNFNNSTGSIPPALQDLFIELSIKAVQAYLYTEGRLILKQYEVNHNVDLSPYLEIIEEYSGALEEYESIKREKWKASAMSADPEQMEEYIDNMMF